MKDCLMTDEQLIEEAKKAILDNFHAPDARHPSWWINPEEMARAVLAVFEERWSHTQTVNVERAEWERLKAAEKAQTPTDDEREALDRVIIRLFADTSGGLLDKGRRGLLVRAILGAGFRRSVPEPSAEPKHDESCAEWCNHCQVCGDGIRFGSRCRQHYQNRPEPQAEPSDAERRAAAVAIFEGYVTYDGGRFDWPAYAYDREKAEYVAERALRAASQAGTEQGENHG